MKLKNSLTVNVILTLTLFFWASAYVGIRIGLTSYSPGSLALLRYLVASLCMGIIYLKFSHQSIVRWNHRLELMFIGLGGIGIYNIALNYGEINVSAGVASFVMGFMPVITILLSAIFFKENQTIQVWVGVVISLLGLLIMMLAENETRIDTSVFIILLSALMGGLYNLTQKRYLKYYHPVVITTWVIWGGTFLLLLFLPQLLSEVAEAHHNATFSAIYMGIFPAALAYLGWCYILDKLAAAKASIYLFVLPILSTLLGFLVLHEIPSFLSLLGGCITLLGAFFSSRYASLSLVKRSSFQQKNVIPTLE